MFQDSIVALVTPFKQGEFDAEAYRKLIDFQISQGTSAILTCGCTGEPATMTHQEHCQIIRFTVEAVNRRVPVIAGTGSNNTKEAITLTQWAEKAGADAALLITPYYNKPVPAGLYQHYKAVAESVSLPIILYNVPSRTGISILPETVAELAQIKNIIGIKEASGNLDQVSRIITLCPDSFEVYSGDDSLTLPIMAIGGRGVVSVAANVVPGAMAQMTKAVRNGDWLTARNLHRRLFPLFKALFLETNPIPVKGALALLGMIEPELRLPLTSPQPQTLEKLRQVLKEAGVKV
ncbi:MAG: 4-hydroxy-tetrahydrodipicolinate synthase [Candidatus Omnitrophica bacterium]|nr:4-hydroxy-tetrahydrodipicolinate synthase [Candidatus Omnitrophota bacterium]MCM8768525.1 4-hydroxy-tetrahydrodipicolinate synthase [Candidatus Omnitrophota bacterium]